MARFVSQYQLDFPEFTLKLQNMVIRQVGEIQDDNDLILIPPPIHQEYIEAHNQISCHTTGIRTRYIEMLRENLAIQYTIPFRPGTQKWVDLVNYLKRLDETYSYAIRGERISRFRLKMLANV